MKVNFLAIIKDHLASLKAEGKDRTSIIDLLVFFLLPAALAAPLSLGGFLFSRDSYSTSITFFGIFAALLLNIQVAIFSVYQRGRKHLDEDDIELIAQRNEIELRRRLLSELNSNISYLTLVSCLALFSFVSLYLTNLTAIWITCISVYLYAHFVLTMLMIIKRAHALFQREYETDS